MIARAVLGGALGRHRGRLALSVLAIALGVALGFAVALVNASAVAEFTGALKSLAGAADLEVKGPRAGFAEALYPALARDPDVAVASPVVEVDARIEGRDEALRIYGVDPFRAAAVTPGLIGNADDPLALLRPGNVFLAPALATALGLAVGDTLTVQAGLRALPLTVAGLARAEAGERYAVMDIAATQDAFARRGTLSRIDLRLRPGASIDALTARIEALLPAGVAVAAPADNARTTLRLSRAYRVNLNVLALVALFTGGLLVFSTQALSVVRRRAHFALLRTLGVTRGQLTTLLVAEGALLGLTGSLLGLAGGYALAYAVLRVVGVDLGAGYFRGVAPQLVLDAGAALAFAVIGIAVAAIASFLPAREAARAQPAAALKAGDEQEAFARLRGTAPGVALLVAGALLTLLPPVAGLPIAGYVAIALLLIGTLLLLPCVASFVLTGLPPALRASGRTRAWWRPGALVRVPPPRAVPAALALAQLRGAPGQAGVSLATIVASVSLMASMAIMVASFRQSLDDWLVRVLPADAYVRAGAAGDSGFMTAEEQKAIAAIEGISRVAFLRAQSVLLDPAQPRVSLLARDLPRADPGAALPIVGDAYAPRAGDPPPVWITESVADARGWAPGARVQLPIAGTLRPFVVAAIWRDYARQQGALVVDRATYISLTGDTVATDAAIWLAPGTNVAQLRERLDAQVPGAERLAFTTPGELRAISLRIFDRTFAVTYALLAVAIVIGLTGLSSSFGALVLARRREFGMLRHLGMTKRQVAAMLGTEGFVVSSLGLAVGLALGFVMSLILVHVVNRQSFHWGMEIHMPWASLAALTIVLLLAAVATTLASGRQAMSGDVIRAVKEDW